MPKWLFSNYRLDTAQIVILAIGVTIALSFAVVAWARARVRPARCANCGYDTRHSNSRVCTECGVELDVAATVLRRKRRRLFTASAALALLTPLVMWSEHHAWSPPLPAFRLVGTRALQHGAFLTMHEARDPFASPSKRTVLHGADGTTLGAIDASVRTLTPAGEVLSYGGAISSGSDGRILLVILEQAETTYGRDRGVDIATVGKDGAVRAVAHGCASMLHFSLAGTPARPRLSVADRELQVITRYSHAYSCPVIFSWDGNTFRYDKEASDASAEALIAEIGKNLSWLRLDASSNELDVESLTSQVGYLLLANKPETAWRLFDTAWPDSLPGKQEQRNKIESTMRKSKLARLVKEHHDNAGKAHR